MEAQVEEMEVMGGWPEGTDPGLVHLHAEYKCEHGRDGGEV